LREYITALLTVASLTLALAGIPLTVNSNPIPAPTVILTHEHIRMVFRQGPGADGVTVTVTGIYPFKNVGFKELNMYFPVPPEVISNGKAWVSVNGHPVKYEVVNEGEVYVPGNGVKPFKYDTVLGVLPMLKWHIKLNRSFKDFTVNVTYRYVLKPKEVEVPCNCSPSGKVGIMVHRTIYAMATGRFYYIYSKRVVADVTLKFIGQKFNYAPINISLVPAPSEMSEGYSKIVLPPGNTNKTITLVIKSPLFKGMRKDILIEFTIPRSMPTTTQPQQANHPNTNTPPTTSLKNSNNTEDHPRTTTHKINTSNQTTPNKIPNNTTIYVLLLSLFAVSIVTTAIITSKPKRSTN